MPTAGIGPTGSASLPARSPVISSNAARRSRADISPIPACKDVPGLAELGYPIAEVEPSGELIITKPVAVRRHRRQAHGHRADSLRSARSVRLSHARRRSRHHRRRGRCRSDRIACGWSAHAASRVPRRLKATAFVESGMLGEAEISYAGPNALARAQLAAEIVTARMAKRAPELADPRRCRRSCQLVRHSRARQFH